MCCIVKTPAKMFFNGFFFSFLEFAPGFPSGTPVLEQNMSLNIEERARKADRIETGTFRRCSLKGVGMNEQNQLVAARGKKANKKAESLVF